MWRKQPESRPSSSVEAAPSAQPLPVAPPIANVERALVATERVDSASEVTRLTPGILVKGELTGQANLYVDGEVQGTIRLLESDVTVGPNGRVQGDIQARDLMVQGSVRGNLQVGGRLFLGRSSVVAGDLVSRRVIIEEGANFRGRVDMGRPDGGRSSRASKAANNSVEFPSVARLVKEDRH